MGLGWKANLLMVGQPPVSKWSIFAIAIVRNAYVGNTHILSWKEDVAKCEK